VSQEYEYLLSGTAARTLLGTTPRRRRKAEQFISALTDDPFRTPDFVEKGKSGRQFHVHVEGDIVVTLWVDHATKEVRIIQIEFI
jgi:hypothetical protein